MYARRTKSAVLLNVITFIAAAYQSPRTVPRISTDHITFEMSIGES